MVSSDLFCLIINSIKMNVNCNSCEEQRYNKRNTVFIFTGWHLATPFLFIFSFIDYNGSSDKHMVSCEIKNQGYQFFEGLQILEVFKLIFTWFLSFQHIMHISLNLSMPQHAWVIYTLICTFYLMT